ncbi:MAG TPA: NAD(P)H-hydrate dehydratase [Rhabdochlamydiaceae bacterium]|nr:NAD(P)H-hydrate dehydratase [Rhabdochlamydiaceae bacterium]
MINGQKIVSAEEMQRIEKLAAAAGHDLAKFMDNAADGIALATERFLEQYDLPKKIMLLTGKGNNGGDAYTAGALLLKQGYSVLAVSAFPLKECSPLCRERHDRFIKRGGKVVPLSDLNMEGYGVILDGLVGTGFRGKAAGPLAKAIEWANNSDLPILALDIPSGLNGTTGEVGSVAIDAVATIYLGLPKLGFFLGKGWDHVGDLIGVDFGLPEKLLMQAREEALLLDPASLQLPYIRRSRHKYEAGYVLGIAGSPQMTGAAALATAGVLRSGAGIVRLFSMSHTPSAQLLAEVIHEEYDLKKIQEESKRAAAYFVGPGLGRTSDVEKLLKQLLPTLRLPTVLDADALYFLAKNPSWKIPKHSILTPHHGEMEKLIKKKPSLKICQNYVEKHKATLVLKGAPTMIFHPGKKPLVIAHGDPGMATAGSGDVLTGILAGLLAQKMPPHEAAALGVYLHARAGEIAALHLTSYCMIASDILNYLPEAFAELRSCLQSSIG